MMGLKWEVCGYGKGKEMLKELVRGEGGDLMGLVKLMKGEGKVWEGVKEKKWCEFGGGYNGGGYGKKE